MKMRRFQSKLMLAFVFATTLVSVAVIELSSRQVKRNYERHFKEAFESQVHYMLDARVKRSENQMEMARALAESDFVVARLKQAGRSRNSEKDLSRLQNFMAEMKVPMGRGGRPSGGGGRMMGMSSNLIVGVMDLNGKIEYLSSPLKKRSAGGQQEGASIKQQLEELKNRDTPHIAYLPQVGPNDSPTIREVIVTQVKDPASGDLLGALILSLTSTVTSAERIIDRYHREIEGAHFETAVYLDGSLYPSSNLGFKPPFGRETRKVEFDFDALEAVLANEIGGGTARIGDFQAEIDGQPHLVHYCAINPDSPLSVAWQIAAFPMSTLQRDLSDLRIKGSGIGLVGIVIGVICSWFLARSFSVPIRALSEGTRRIREGDLNLSIPVLRNDELGDLTGSFNQMTEELRQKERYRSLLEKVSDESVAQAMIQGTLDPELGGELKEVSILFCDIRGFTHQTELMSPDRVIDMLNQHMTALANVVRDHYGVVDKFVGDEIMAVFGGLKSYGNDAAHATRCAHQMILERERLNQSSGTPISIGIGIATGEVVAGCMGSRERLNYTVLGARVNLAARLCGQAGSGEVILDQETYERIGDTGLLVEKIDDQLLKGFSKPIPAWRMTKATASVAV